MAKLENPKSHSPKGYPFFSYPPRKTRSLSFFFLGSSPFFRVKDNSKGCLPCSLVSKTRKALLQDLDQGSEPGCFSLKPIRTQEKGSGVGIIGQEIFPCLIREGHHQSASKTLQTSLCVYMVIQSSFP